MITEVEFLHNVALPGGQRETIAWRNPKRHGSLPYVIGCDDWGVELRWTGPTGLTQVRRYPWAAVSSVEFEPEAPPLRTDKQTIVPPAPPPPSGPTLKKAKK